ncbi:putative protease Do-like 14 [Bienertia sinuspersici]
METNLYLDAHVKRAALRVSHSVVSLVSFTGEEELYQCSGTIIECYNDYTGIIITSANLIRPKTKYTYGDNIVADKLKVIVKLSNGRSSTGEICAYDFHYNFAVLNFKSDSPLQAATLRRLEDCLPLNPSKFASFEEKSFQLRPHSDLMNLCPGDEVVAVGRYFATPFDLMAAPGQYCLDCCEYDCKELFMTTCRMTRCGDGSPLINIFGEVIGIAFFDVSFTPFIPINVACKWWDYYKMYGELRRLSLGMESISFHSAHLSIAEKVIQRFPSISKGVIVERVIAGSSAQSAGLHLNDVIVQCGGKVVQCFLQFFEIMWDNVGQPVDLVVVRADHVIPLTLKLVVIESVSDNLNRWPLFK